MSRSFITDMQHFIDEKGAIPESMPRQARQLAEKLGSIVACVTSQPSTLPKAVVSCWSKMKGKSLTVLRR